MQLLNKVDLLRPEQRGALEAWFAANCTAERTLHISALNATNTAAVVDWVVSKLPEGPSMYPKVSGAGKGVFVGAIFWACGARRRGDSSPRFSSTWGLCSLRCPPRARSLPHWTK